MSTLAELKVLVARDLRDVANKTFSSDVLGDLINSAIAEVSRILPEQFQEDIVPVADTLTYRLRAAGAAQSATGVAATNLLTSAAHGLTAGTAIRFTALTGGTGLTVSTIYWVIATDLTSTTFKLAAGVGGPEINFTTDITVGTFNRAGSDVAIPEITLRLVEVWDVSETPIKWRGRFTPGSGEWSRSSAAGWRVWNGMLEITNRMEAVLDPDVHILRVWGYSPYQQLVASSDVLAAPVNWEWALRAYCRVQALESLDAERALFAQWQTQSNNTDISAAQLLGMLNAAREDWRRRSNRLFQMREAS